MKTTALAVQSPRTEVEQCISTLRRERARFLTRRAELSRIARRLRTNQAHVTVPEEHELLTEMTEPVAVLIADISSYCEHLNVEIEKMERGAVALKDAPSGEVTSAFRDYILTDTAISLKNITLARYDYDSAISSLRDFERRFKTSSEESE